jgi:hypothetical protein
MRYVFFVPGIVAATVMLVVSGATAIPARADTPAAQADGVSAVWTAKQKRYTYMGFTSRYSCDGLRDKIRATLLKFGAAKDLKVDSMACPSGPGRPTTFPGVSITMQVLTPAADAGAAGDAASGKSVPAHWKLVDLTARRDPLDVAGDCELIEQIKQQILPLFTTRNVQYQSTCIPNQLQVGGTQLKAEFLIADEPAKPTGQ